MEGEGTLLLWQPLAEVVIVTVFERATEGVKDCSGTDVAAVQHRPLLAGDVPRLSFGPCECLQIGSIRLRESGAARDVVQAFGGFAKELREDAACGDVRAVPRLVLAIPREKVPPPRVGGLCCES